MIRRLLPWMIASAIAIRGVALAGTPAQEASRACNQIEHWERQATALLTEIQRASAETSLNDAAKQACEVESGLAQAALERVRTLLAEARSQASQAWSLEGAGNTSGATHQKNQVDSAAQRADLELQRIRDAQKLVLRIVDRALEQRAASNPISQRSVKPPQSDATRALAAAAQAQDALEQSSRDLARASVTTPDLRMELQPAQAALERLRQNRDAAVRAADVARTQQQNRNGDAASLAAQEAAEMKDLAELERQRIQEELSKFFQVHREACDSSRPQPYIFSGPARFPLTQTSPEGEVGEAPGALIYEDMAFEFDDQGNYVVRFTVEAEPLPITMRLQLRFRVPAESGGCDQWHTVTLKPIRLLPSDAEARLCSRNPTASAADSAERCQLPGPSESQLHQVVCRGKSSAVKEHFAQMGQAEFERLGTARFGFGFADGARN